MRKHLVVFRLLLVVQLLVLLTGCGGEVLRENEKTYIVDRTGEKWNISQAVSAGFDPDDFEFGLGRNAFTPLNDAVMSRGTTGWTGGRVLGVSENGKEAKAYSVEKLYGHEIANTLVGKKPIAAAY